MAFLSGALGAIGSLFGNHGAAAQAAVNDPLMGQSLAAAQQFQQQSEQDNLADMKTSADTSHIISQNTSKLRQASTIELIDTQADGLRVSIQGAQNSLIKQATSLVKGG